jgi:C-terminal processing protease CtpA/Prc
LTFKAKLKVGDMLLAVNTESFLTINYDEAALILKQVTGNIRLLVVNPNDEIEAQNRLSGCLEQDSKYNPDEKVKPTRVQEKGTSEDSKNQQKRDIKNFSTDMTKKSNNISNSPTKQVISADEPKSSEQEFQDISVELSKIPGKGLGLSVVGRRDGCGVFISDMVLGGSADVDGRILRGDQIMSVNGSDLSQAKQDEAVAILKVSQGDVKIKVRRYKGTIK